MKTVFLGGTCGNNDWRKGFMLRCMERGVPKEAFFDPTVAEWNDEARANEARMKAAATHMIFYIASPKQEGNPLSAYSMVEATMALYDNPNTVVVFDNESLTGHALKAAAQACWDLQIRFPNAAIFGIPREAEDWLVGRLV